MEINPNPDSSLSLAERFRDDPDMFDGVEADGDNLAAMHDVDDCEPIDWEDHQNDWESSFEID